MPNREAIFPANRHDLYEMYGYSAAIRSGDLLFVSGQVGSHADGSPEPDFEKQPLAGSVLAVRPGVSGLPESRFAG